MPRLRQHATDSFARAQAAKPSVRPKIPARSQTLADACLDVLEACEAGDAEALQSTLDSHAKLLPQIVNAQDNTGWTALHIAVGWCAVECIAVLLKQGADPDIRNDQGQNARDLAFQLGYDTLAASILPIPGAREAAQRRARQAELREDIAMITRGLPDTVVITPMHLRPHIRRPH